MAEGYSHGKVRPVDPDAEIARLEQKRKPPADSLVAVIADALAMHHHGLHDDELTPGDDWRAAARAVAKAIRAAGWTPPPSLAERVRKIATRDRAHG